MEKATDVSAGAEKLKALEAALQEAERLSVANRYAAAIMHEVNNPLEAITNLIYLLGQEELGPPARGYVDQIREQLTVLTAVTRPSLAFHREQKGPQSSTCVIWWIRSRSSMAAV